jgi:cytochrome b involved in lipid metabolism
MRQRIIFFLFLFVFVLTGCLSKQSNQTGESTTTDNSYTMVDIQNRNTLDNCWTVVRGQVYNLTDFISKHPGGADAVSQLCGVDGTDKFVGQHGGSRLQESTLEDYKLGDLVSE